MNEKQIENFWNKVNIKSENECQDCKNKNRLVIPEGDRFKQGHIPKNSLITNDIALEIYNIIKNRRNNNEPLRLKNLSIQYNIPYNSIRDISCGRTYINKL